MQRTSTEVNVYMQRHQIIAVINRRILYIGENLHKLLPSLLSDPLLFIVVHVCILVHVNKLVFKANTLFCMHYVGNVIYHKFSHSDVSYRFNGKNMNVMLE